MYTRKFAGRKFLSSLREIYDVLPYFLLLLAGSGVKKKEEKRKRKKGNCSVVHTLCV